MGSSDSHDSSASGSSGSGAVALKGNPRILVVDDEELMREVAAMMIEEEGGTVVSSGSGRDAVSILEREAAKIDCIFCDFSMPEVNGFDVYNAAQKIRAGIPFVMVSGLRIVPEVEELRRTGKIEFVSKPFHQRDLFSALNRARQRAAGS